MSTSATWARLDSDGKVLWKNNKLSYNPVHGNGGSPIVVEDKLIFSCDGNVNPFVVALNKDNGEVVWKTPRSVNAGKKFSFHTPLLITVNDKKQPSAGQRGGLHLRPGQRQGDLEGPHQRLFGDPPAGVRQRPGLRLHGL